MWTQYHFGWIYILDSGAFFSLSKTQTYHLSWAKILKPQTFQIVCIKAQGRLVDFEIWLIINLHPHYLQPACWTCHKRKGVLACAGVGASPGRQQQCGTESCRVFFHYIASSLRLSFPVHFLS